MAINFNGVKVISSGGGGGAASWPGDGSKLLSGDGTQVTVGSGLTFSAGQIAAEELTWPGVGSGMTAADGSLVTVGNGLSLSAGGLLSASGIRKSYIATVGDDPTVSLLLHMDGANNSTTFTDSSITPRTVTSYGNAKISTTEYKFGSSSADFDGNGDYLRIPYDAGLDLSSVNSTIEGWVNPRVTSAQTIISKAQSGWDYNFELRIHDSTTIRYLGHYGSSFITVPTITTGTWHHFAVVGISTNYLNSGTLYFYWNGVLRATLAQTIWNYSSMDLTIGCSSYNSPSVFFNGYIDEIRITKGTARYTSSFTPSSSAFPSVNGSELSATSVGDTVYSSNGIYICTSLSPLTWKKFSVSSTITL